ncbi:MAG: chorismate mutase [Defluviitaleaceae bacterium]|nr:chorismate mutase [Defluviitaleaceae bacterium]
MDLNEFRIKIDKIDDEIIRLFKKRMAVSEEIALYKRERSLPIFDPARERKKLYEAESKVEEEHRGHIAALFSVLFEASRAEQERVLNSGGK